MVGEKVVLPDSSREEVPGTEPRVNVDESVSGMNVLKSIGVGTSEIGGEEETVPEATASEEMPIEP